MPRTANEILSESVRNLRKQRGWSQEEFAHRCGLHRTYVGAIERGERNITLATLDAIATAFGVSAAKLLDGGSHE
jgi:transcriptional regulator with XRE-family HTH domain